MMHLDNDQALLHRLVAGDGQSAQADWSGTGTPVIVCSLLSIISMVILMAMCLCRETGKSERGEPMLKEVTPVVDRKSHVNTNSVNGPVEETEIKVTVTQRDSRHSNGSAVLVKDGPDNGRPKSHDQRALPEIPGDSRGVMQTDDEDDDEGHYDIIRGRGRHQHTPDDAVSPPPINTVTAVTHHTPNLYEKVGDTGSDSTYAGVKDDTSDTGYPALKNSNPYATVEGIGNADYAHIEEKNKTNPRKLTTLQRLQELQSSASTDTLNDSYASIPPPPVPDKHFTYSETSSTLTAPGAIGGGGGGGGAGEGGGGGGNQSPQTASSPSLPPRNRTSSSGEEASGGHPLTDVMVGGGSEDDQVLDDVMDGPEPTGKREPPYSSVTARESLANLRQRQAAELALKQPLPHDATYESVNYDQITSPANQGLGSLTSDRNSLTSDLYAEIASGSGENSTRSSMYAKVGDVSNIREVPAPTPPPVDILKQLSIPKNEEDIPDPGYSIIRRTRPQSAYSTLSSTPRTMSPGEEGDGSQPVYAVVDKGRRNRNTVCVPTDVNENGPILPNGSAGDQMYAQVNKPRRPQHFTQVFPGSAASYLGMGARPKVRQQPMNNNPGPSTAAVTSPLSHNVSQLEEDDSRDPHYQTIPSDVQIPDPNYDDIIDNQFPEVVLPTTTTMEFDPNYERVCTESMTRMRVTSPGVATEIVESEIMSVNNPHGMVHISDHHVDSNFWQRREHVYQEISSGSRDRERMTERKIHITTDL